MPRRKVIVQIEVVKDGWVIDGLRKGLFAIPDFWRTLLEQLSRENCFYPYIAVRISEVADSDGLWLFRVIDWEPAANGNETK